MSALGDLWLYVADSSCRGYSPLYDRICRVVARSEPTLDLVRAAPPRGHNPVLLLAAVHYLLLSGLDHPLAAVYAGNSDADPGPLFVDLCASQREELVALLSTEQVNTNEVGRSAIIGPSLTSVASRLGQPVGLVDVGCSAGLNLLCDRYRLDYGPFGATGPDDATVRISCEVVSGAPPIADALPTIAARIGLDHEPIDVGDEQRVRWQLACVWPDTGRLERTRSALEEARRHSRTLVRGDAVESVGQVVDRLPAGVPAVVVTTWVVAYFDEAQRAGFHDALAEASARRPIAWISAENEGVVAAIPSGTPPDDDDFEWSVLGLVDFRDGTARAERLGYVHPHGSRLHWLGGTG